MPAPSIRAATLKDAAAINQIYNHYIRHTAITFELEAWSIAQREAWFEQFTAADDADGDDAGKRAHRYHAVVAEHHGVITGFAYNSRYHPRAGYQFSTETTIYTAAAGSDNNGHQPGTGRALYTALFQRLADTDLHRAYAIIALPNPRSIAFHRRFGFAPIGTLHQVGRKFGRFMDVAWFEKALK